MRDRSVASLAELEVHCQIAGLALAGPRGVRCWADVEADLGVAEPAWSVTDRRTALTHRVDLEVVRAGVWRVLLNGREWLAAARVSSRTRDSLTVMYARMSTGLEFEPAAMGAAEADQVVQVGLFGKVMY